MEGTALGVIYKQGPCKAYAVLSAFANSQTSVYRSGAGAVYPLLQRLEGAGLIRSELAGEHKLYTLTEEGLSVLTHWLDFSTEDAFVSCCLDDLRSRAYFLKALDSEARKRFAEASLASLKNLLAECRKQVDYYRKSGDAFSEFAMQGAVLETLARIRWMKRLADSDL